MHRERLHRRPRQDGPLRQHADSGQGPHPPHRDHHGRPEGRRPVQVRSSRPNQESRAAFLCFLGFLEVSAYSGLGQGRMTNRVGNYTPS